MEPILTNIFCLIGKPGSGRETLLKGILSDDKFIKRYEVRKLVSGTTRPMKPGEKQGVTYYFLTKEEFEDLDPKEFIESRSYDNIYTEDLYHYFTLKKYIRFGKNYIAKTSTFQYSEFKKWALVSQLGDSMNRIQIYPILVTAPIFEREKRLMGEASVDSDVYNICAKLISERFEFETVIRDNPEIIDHSNRDTCIIDNGKYGDQCILNNIKQIEDFIVGRLTRAG